jgi:hypothetical protein
MTDRREAALALVDELKPGMTKSQVTPIFGRLEDLYPTTEVDVPQYTQLVSTQLNNDGPINPDEVTELKKGLQDYITKNPPVGGRRRRRTRKVRKSKKSRKTRSRKH